MSRLTLYRSVVAVGFVVALGIASMVAAERTAASMATAADRFLGSLTPEQRATATLPFDGEDRTRFHFIPTEMHARKGLRIKEMTPAQREAAHGLLRASLSEVGYQTTSDIMALEAVLAAIETGGKLVRDPEIYYFSVFGTPSPEGTWGWRAEGHHVSLNFTVVNGTAVATTPSFLGTNPAEVRDGPQRGLRLLGPREDAARTLLMALDERQRATAVFDQTALRDIVTGNAAQVDPLEPAGIMASAMTSAQRDRLMAVIDQYLMMMPEEVASERLAKIRDAGVERIAFAWAGAAERGAQHYYRVQGPTFLIEFDNTQNNGNHVHSIWRDFNGDFGRDLLREHLRASLH